MTDEPQSPDPAPLPDAAAAPEPSPEPEAPPPPPPRRRGRSSLPLVYALALLVLAGVAFFLWGHPTPGGPSPTVNQAQRVDELENQVQGLGGQVKSLTAQLQAVAGQVRENAARPAGDPQAITTLRQQLAQMQQRQAQPAPPAPDLAPLQQKLASLAAEVAALRTQPQPAAPTQPSPAEAQDRQALDGMRGQLADLGKRLDQLAAAQQGVGQQLSQLQSAQKDLTQQLNSLRQATGQAQDGLTRRISAAEAVLGELRQSVQHLSASAGAVSRSLRIQAALADLEAGRPLGTIPGAPPAVAKFASQPPPTLADLRQSFPQAARAALAASRPSTEGKPFLDRLWTRAQGLVTVRQGEHVLAGDPAAGVIARAQTDLDAGDLADTVKTLGTLSGAPAEAMAGWLAQAKTLLEARAALLGMAGQG